MHGAWQCISIFGPHSGDIITAGNERGRFTAGLMACIAIQGPDQRSGPVSDSASTARPETAPRLPLAVMSYLGFLEPTRGF